MLDKNAKIEQFIYTACGKDNKGGFSLWAKSQGVDDAVLEFYYNKGAHATYDTSIQKLVNLAQIPANRHLYEKQVRTERKLKPGAKPHGLFNKKYSEDDYETVEYVARNEVVVLDQSDNVNIEQLMRDKHDNGEDIDFREHPQDAPYRIIATKLHDGRLFVMRRTMIGMVYSDQDVRRGNFCDSVLIFPAGTEIEDLDVKNLPFTIGLEPKHHKSKLYPNRPYEPAPEYLPTLTAQDLYKKTPTQFKQTQPPIKQAKPQTTVKTQTAQAKPQPKPQPKTEIKPEVKPETKTDVAYANIIAQALKYKELSHKLAVMKAERSNNNDSSLDYDIDDYTERTGRISKTLDAMIGRLSDSQIKELNQICEELKVQAREEDDQKRVSGLVEINSRLNRETAKRTKNHGDLRV